MSVMSGRGLGIYGNSIVHREQNEFDKKAHRALNGEPISAEDAAWDEASPEQIRAQFERLSKSDQEKATAKASQEQLDVWVKTRPEYRDTPSNAKQLLNQCKAMFGTVTPTAEQADLAFLAIADTGLLDIDQKELAKQKGVNEIEVTAAMIPTVDNRSVLSNHCELRSINATKRTRAPKASTMPKRRINVWAKKLKLLWAIRTTPYLILALSTASPPASTEDL